MNHFSQKVLKYLLLLVVFVISFNQVNAANLSINDNEAKSTSADLSDGDSVEFVGTNGVAQGELTVNSNRSLTSITAPNSSGMGNINFTAPFNATLIINGDIGSNSNKVNQITLNADGTLSSSGDIYLQNGINTATDGTVTLTLNSTSNQTITAAIGSTNKLNSIDLSGAGTKTFSGTDLKTTNFTTNTGAGLTTINNNGALDLGTTTLNENLTIGSAATSVNMGATTIANSKNLTLTNSATLTSLEGAANNQGTLL